MDFGSPFVFTSSDSQPAIGNCVSLKLSAVAATQALVTGEPIVCKKCSAIFNRYSSISASENGKSIWDCEFCNFPNELTSSAEETQQFLITGRRMDFFLGQSLDKKQEDTFSEGQRIIFCIDTSGSMSMTTALTIGKQAVFKSRLEFVQQAVMDQLKKIKEQSPKTQVGVITFSKDVWIISDQNEKVLLNPDLLDSYEGIIEKAESFSLKKSISETYDGLIKEVESLEESGCTSLGPALLVAATMCSQVVGSKTIICTDGLANNGVGSLEKNTNDPFYEQLGQFAKRKGTNISVISIAGTNTRLEKLGVLADLTGGMVNIVTPSQMAANFDVALNSKVLATQSRATLVVSHPSVTLVRMVDDTKSKKSTTSSTESTTVSANANTDELELKPVVEDIGIVTNESEFCYEFSAEGKQSQVYFQLQLQYELVMTKKKYLTVFTFRRPTTDDTIAANKDLNIPVLSSNVAQQCAQLTQIGEYEKAREKATKVKTLLQPHIKTPWQHALFAIFMEKYNEAIAALQQQEQKESADVKYLDAYQRQQLRSEQRYDATSNVMYNMRQAKSAACIIS